jgi:antitoxin HicB
MNWIYGTTIARQGGDFVVSVRDLPEVVTSGDTHKDAITLAADAIEVAVIGRMKDEAPLPSPSPVANGEIAVPLAPRVAAKASVYHLWRKSGISKSELARRMGRGETEIRRILDPATGTKIDQIAEATRALGRDLVIGIV